jgi:hypothetical protein
MSTGISDNYSVQEELLIAEKVGTRGVNNSPGPAFRGFDIIVEYRRVITVDYTIQS